MISKIAWKNIWRSRSRSFVVIGSVVIGVWAFIFMMGFTTSMSKGYVNNAVRFQTSHIQLHNPAFKEDKEVKYTLDPSVYDEIAKMPEVKSSGIRSLANGMIRSSQASRGITIIGVEPKQEEELTQLSEKIVEGEYFQEGKQHEILISKKLAENLKVKLRKKIVLYFQDLTGEVVTGSFRIVGLFDIGNKNVDLGNVLVTRSELNRYLGNPDAAHEIAILLKDKDQSLEKMKAELTQNYPNLKVEDYTQLSPEIKVIESHIYTISIFMLFIFMLALIFGIVNTMLMAILERTHELGMLIAIGMSRWKLFLMIVLETIYLSIIGAPFGMLLGWATVSWYGNKGIDLSSFSKGVQQFGMDTIIYPELELNIIIQLTIAVAVTAVLASLFPAIKAIRLQPLDAIHRT